MDKPFEEELFKTIKRTHDAVRYELTENFDLFYKILILESILTKKTMFITPTFMLLYLNAFLTDSERIAFCIKMIERVKDKKNNQLKDHPEIATELFRMFTKYWSQAKDHIILDNLSLQMEQREKLDALKGVLDEIMLRSNRPNKKTSPGRKKMVVLFENLFRNEGVGNELKKIFLKHRYIENNNWLGQSKANNELAIAYYVLKESEYGFQLIKTGDKKPQLIAFYKEFGLKVSENTEGSPNTTYRNISTEPSVRDTHDEFIRIFQPLLQYKA